MNSVDDVWIVLKERDRDPFSAELVKDFLRFLGLILKAENVLDISSGILHRGRRP